LFTILLGGGLQSSVVKLMDDVSLHWQVENLLARMFLRCLQWLPKYEDHWSEKVQFRTTKLLCLLMWWFPVLDPYITKSWFEEICAKINFKLTISTHPQITLHRHSRRSITTLHLPLKNDTISEGKNLKALNSQG
jgi:hypothetical protein